MKEPLLKLPVLSARRASLEKCVYCPKLCRAACPVSNAEPNESLTPWGKMSTAFFLARGDVDLTPESATLAWACTGCFACRERCDHKNPVEATLADARAGLFERGVAPTAAREVAQRAELRASETRAAIAELRSGGSATEAFTGVKLLLGCSYVRKAKDEARDAITVTEALLGTKVELVEACCGYPARAAGDRAGFHSAQRELARAVGSARRFIVLDPGCARTLLQDYDGVALPKPELLIDIAASSLDRFQQLDPLPGVTRYHDPCQLGRGLNRFDGPRAILAKLLGAAPAEFERNKDAADCSGGGGIVPRTMPEVSASIAAQRLGEHDRLGGGRIVTACAGSLRRFRSNGADVVDIVSLMARALRSSTERRG